MPDFEYENLLDNTLFCQRGLPFSLDKKGEGLVTLVHLRIELGKRWIAVLDSDHLWFPVWPCRLLIGILTDVYHLIPERLWNTELFLSVVPSPAVHPPAYASSKHNNFFFFLGETYGAFPGRSFFKALGSGVGCHSAFLKFFKSPTMMVNFKCHFKPEQCPVI